jgi:hypothetical protein
MADRRRRTNNTSDPYADWFANNDMSYTYSPNYAGTYTNQDGTVSTQATRQAAAGIAPAPAKPAVGWTAADTTQNWVNENPYEFMQGKLQGSGLMSATGGTSFDTWLTNSYLPRLMGGYYQNMTKDASGNLTESGIDKANARRMFLHRPDAERMPNPFAAGPGRWSMWD